MGVSLQVPAGPLLLLLLPRLLGGMQLGPLGRHLPPLLAAARHHRLLLLQERVLRGGERREFVSRNLVVLSLT